MSDSPRTGLTLALGPANAGKMGHVLRWWEERLPQRPVVVAPTAPDARELTAEMVRRTGGVVGQTGALTFDGLMRLLLGRSPRYASDLELHLIVSRLLRETPLQALERAVQLPGVATALLTLLRQLGESGRSPEELDRILTRWASAERDTTALASDIRRLLAGYVETCTGLGLMTRPAAVREGGRAAGTWTRPVALYGFTSFTPGQRALVEALSHRGEVLLTFNHDHSRMVNLSTPAEISWWEARAADVVDLTPEIRAYSSAAIAYLAGHFLSDEPRPEPPAASSGDDGVRFLLASGQYAEAELAAEQISTLLRAEFKPGEIAVVVRRIRGWSRLLARVFDSCGIPYQMDDRCVLGDTGIGYAFLSALRGVASDDPGGILAYLRSPYSGVSLEDVSDLELTYRRGTAKGARILAALARDQGLEHVESLWRMIRSAAGEPPEDQGSRDSWFDPATAEELGRRMLVAGLCGSTLGSREMEEDARAFRAMHSAFAAMSDLAGPITGVRPLAVLRPLAQVSVPGSRSEAEEAVQILSVQRARARRFDAVVVLGLVEGEFPGKPDTPSLLTPAETARLDALGQGLFTPETDEEGALFLSAVSRARRTLLLSARDAEDDGSDCAPSRFWEEAKRLLRVGEEDHCRRTLADQVFAPEKAPSLRHYLRARAARERAVPSLLGDGPSVQVRSWGRTPDRLTSPEVLGELAATECFSPSSLEAYAGCPFVWFVERVIGAEDVDFELDSRMVGQLLHTALRTTYSELASNGLLPLCPERLAAAESRAVATVHDLMESDQCPGSPSERRIAAWRVKQMIRNLFRMEIAAGGTLVPSETEVCVGGWQGVDIGGLRIKGRIDRVDVTPDGQGLFVIDYKSGAIPGASAIGTEAALQLPLYLMALAVEHPAARVLGGAYLSLSEKARSGVVAAGSEEVLGSGVQGLRVLDEANENDLFRITGETARGAVAGIRAGVIAPRSDRKCPPWCRLGPLCRSRRGGYRR